MCSYVSPAGSDPGGPVGLLNGRQQGLVDANRVEEWRRLRLQQIGSNRVCVDKLFTSDVILQIFVFQPGFCVKEYLSNTVVGQLVVGAVPLKRGEGRRWMLAESTRDKRVRENTKKGGGTMVFQAR